MLFCVQLVSWGTGYSWVRSVLLSAVMLLAASKRKSNSHLLRHRPLHAAFRRQDPCAGPAGLGSSHRSALASSSRRLSRPSWRSLRCSAVAATGSGADTARKQETDCAYHVFLPCDLSTLGHAGPLRPRGLFSGCGAALQSRCAGCSWCPARALERRAFSRCSQRASVVVPGKRSSVPFKEQLCQEASSRLSSASHWQSWPGKRQWSSVIYDNQDEPS